MMSHTRGGFRGVCERHARSARGAREGARGARTRALLDPESASVYSVTSQAS